MVQGALQPVMDVFDSCKDIIQTVAGFVLPPPGGMIAVAVFELAAFAVKAMFNSELCRELALKCARLMKVICEYREKLDHKLMDILLGFDRAVDAARILVKNHSGVWYRIAGRCVVPDGRQVCGTGWQAGVRHRMAGRWVGRQTAAWLAGWATATGRSLAGAQITMIMVGVGGCAGAGGSRGGWGVIADVCGGEAACGMRGG